MMNRATAISVLFLVILKSRRALDLDGESELEFDEKELNELDIVGVETAVFEGDRELKGKSSGSKSGKGRRNLDVNGAHVIDSDRELKGKSSKGARAARAGGRWTSMARANSNSMKSNSTN